MEARTATRKESVLPRPPTQDSSGERSPRVLPWPGVPCDCEPLAGASSSRSDNPGSIWSSSGRRKSRQGKLGPERLLAIVVEDHDQVLPFEESATPSGLSPGSGKGAPEDGTPPGRAPTRPRCRRCGGLPWAHSPNRRACRPEGRAGLREALADALTLGRRAQPQLGPARQPALADEPLPKPHPGGTGSRRCPRRSAAI